MNEGDLPEWVWSRPEPDKRTALPRRVRERMLEVRALAREVSTKPSEFTFVDLFAGVGGFHHGLSAIGGECIFASEWDRNAAATYWAWTGLAHLSTEDIRTIDIGSIAPHDLLCAGFPCQPFSLAGVSKKNSLGRTHGFDDAHQGDLFFEIVKFARNRSRAILLENVKNLLSHNRGETFEVIRQTLDKAGFYVTWGIVDAAGWVPQHRERVFIVALNKREFTQQDVDNFVFPRGKIQGPLLGSILENEADIDPRYVISRHLWTYLKQYKKTQEAKGNGFGYGLVDSSSVSRTLSARYHKDGAEILISRGKGNPRRLTPREASLLMGFGKGYAKAAGFGDAFPQVVSDTQAYRQFGNSVSPLVVQAIGERIKQLLL